MARFHLFMTEWCIYIYGTYIYMDYILYIYIYVLYTIYIWIIYCEYIYMDYILYNYIWIIYCVYIYIYIYVYICVCVCHILIHSSTDKIIGCFHILVIVNNVAMNIEVCISFQISVFVFFEYSGVEYLNCIVDLFLIF